MIMTEVKVSDVLKDIRRNAETGRVGNRGICHLMEKYLGKLYRTNPLLSDSLFSTWIRERREIFAKWPKYSGDKHFPVPYKTYISIFRKKLNPYDAFNTKPKWKGKYGKLRRELLDFLILEFERLGE